MRMNICKLCHPDGRSEGQTDADQAQSVTARTFLRPDRGQSENTGVGAAWGCKAFRLR